MSSPSQIRLMLFAAGVIVLGSLHLSATSEEDAVIVVDGRDGDRRFDGVGAISAGGSSRLLVDYPEPERSQILDYLFKPKYGASLDVLKVEIGGDMNATAGAEPSHMRMPGKVNCSRGYEWWLMKEAKARNPDIQLAGLEWGAPGWFEGGFWSQDNIEYLLTWLGCAEKHGLQIDYLGGWNERYEGGGYDRDYYMALDRVLEAHGFDTKIVASDEHHPPDYWHIATDMKDDPAFAAAVDILGEHDVCHWRTLYKHCKVSEDALRLGKPLWNSEQSTEDYADWAGALARAMNRNYIDARVTANLNWALVAAFYGTFPAAGTGLILADQPWSGYYDIGKGIWVDAHTTQFTEPGWQYLDGACGYTEGGASYVALRSPDTDDYSIIVETMDASEPDTVQFTITGGLSTETVHLWSTNLASDDPAEYFVHVRGIEPDHGLLTVTLQPDHVYTLSTTTGQRKGMAAPTAGRDQQMPVPYHEDFEHTGSDRLARYFSDVHGAFEAAPCGGERDGTCYRQVITQEPILWHGISMPPTTIVGDPRWWGDYEVRADVLLEEPGYVELLGRVEAQRNLVAGYHLRVGSRGEWRLYTESIEGRKTTLASGQTSIGVGSWHTLALRFEETGITVSIDGQRLATVHDGSHTTGQVGLQVSPWDHAQFDNIHVVPTGPWPRFVPHAQMSAIATSAHTAPYQGTVFTASKAIDERRESMWHTQFAPNRAPLPQAITLDLGRVRPVHGLTYKPRIDGVVKGMITRYKVYVSSDGQTFDQVASGSWPTTIATKVATWERPRRARYVRLEATAGQGDVAAAGEINVATTPIPRDRSFNTSSKQSGETR